MGNGEVCQMAVQKISTWSSTEATNDGLGVFDENQAPSTVNDGGRKVMASVREQWEDKEFFDFGDVPTRTSNTVFTVPGDQTANYQVNRRIKATDSSTLFGTIITSVFTSLTTVTVTLDSGNLSASLTAVALGAAVDQQSIGVGALSSSIGLSQPVSLIIQNNSSNPNFQVDIDADEIVLDDGTDFFRATSVNLTADITASGVDGLDTGSETSDTWYFIWVIYNGTTVSSLLSISSSSPTLPSGYTFKRRVNAIRNDASSDFTRIVQSGETVLYGEDISESLGAPTVADQSKSLTSSVPPISRFVHVMFEYIIDHSSTGSVFSIDVSPTPKIGQGVTMVSVTPQVVNLDLMGSSGGLIALDSSQSFDFDVNSLPNGTNSLTLSILGYVIPI